MATTTTDPLAPHRTVPIRTPEPSLSVLRAAIECARERAAVLGIDVAVTCGGQVVYTARPA